MDNKKTITHRPVHYPHSHQDAVHIRTDSLRNHKIDVHVSFLSSNEYSLPNAHYVALNPHFSIYKPSLLKLFY